MECKKCGNIFSVKTKVDGKIRNLRNRKYCLQCSPFGKHNTRILHIESHDTNLCKKCNKIYKKGKGKRKELCPSCSVSEYRVNLKKEIIDHFGGRCMICGYDKCITALEFHHRDPKVKEFSISGNTFKKEKLIEEAKKCILICVLCHREIHAGILNIGE